MQFSDSQIQQFLDVDFGVAAAAHGRMMGCNPRTQPVGQAGIPTYAAALKARGEKMLTEDEINACIERFTREGWPQRKLMTFVHDQDGEPSCVSNAKLLQHEIQQAQQFGKENVTILSPISLYRFLGSRTSGSNLFDNLERMLKTGALPLDNEANRKRYKHVHPHNGYGVPLPAGWEETAKLFTDGEYAADIETWHEMQDAICKGRTAMYARSGHCILGVSLSFTSSKAKILDYANSWADEWGNPISEELKGGLGHDSERVGRAAASGAIVVLNVNAPFGVAL